MSALKHLIAGLAGGAGAGVNYVTQKRDREADEAQKQQDALFRQMQLAMQQRQLAGQESDRTFNQGLKTTEAANAAEDRRRNIALDKGLQYGRTEAMPDDVASEWDATGLRVDRGVNGLPAQTGLPGVGGVTTPTLIGEGGMGARRGIKTPAEVAQEQSQKFLASAQANGAPPEVIRFLESGGRPEQLSPDKFKTLDEQAAAARAAGDEAIRIRRETAPPAPETVWNTITVTGPDGKDQLVQVDPRSGATRLVQLPEGATPKSAASKPPTGAQENAFIFFQRMGQAVKDLDAIDPAKLTGSDVALINAPDMMGLTNMVTSETGQRYKQAMRAFTEARLRKDSGAAIPESEFINDRKTYFPQPGDSPEALEQKRIARMVALDSLANSTGPVYERYYGTPYTPGQFMTNAPQAAPPQVLAAGPGTHTFANGQTWEVSADGKTARQVK